MDQSQPAPLIGGRYELIMEGKDGSVEVLDHEPWRRCWSCGTTDNEAGEAFCINCGADLRDRRYRGIIAPITPDLVLISSIAEEAVLSLLPPILDQIEDEDEGRVLVLMKQSDAAPANVPLNEITALRVGLVMAHMMDVLHQNNLEMGAIAPNDLGLTATEQPQFLRFHYLERIKEAERADVIRSDLQALAGLLEALTSTPRMTQRLEDSVPSTVPLPLQEPDLAKILREIRTNMITSAEALSTRFDNVLMEQTQVISLRQTVGAATNTGMLRDHNEDSLLYLKLNMNNTSIDRTWGLYIVADGMGGHAGGEVASGLAIRRIAEVIMNEYLTFSLNPDANYDQAYAKEIAQSSVLEANEAVRQEALARSNDMGTTLTMALVVGDRATIANIGDSRTYSYREGKLKRITRDHSLVMRLVELGQIAERDIYTHPQRNAVLRSLGDRSNIEVDVFTERLQDGDSLLLCSDGQWEMTLDNDMERIISSHEHPDQTCTELIKAANKAGGEDNITSILVTFAELKS